MPAPPSLAGAAANAANVTVATASRCETNSQYRVNRFPPEVPVQPAADKRGRRKIPQRHSLSRPAATASGDRQPDQLPSPTVPSPPSATLCIEKNFESFYRLPIESGALIPMPVTT